MFHTLFAYRTPSSSVSRLPACAILFSPPNTLRLEHSFALLLPSITLDRDDHDASNEILLLLFYSISFFFLEQTRSNEAKFKFLVEYPIIESTSIQLRWGL